MALDPAVPTELMEGAMDVRRNSYSPYSGYRVGAAALDEQGRIHLGTNVENIAYGSTICAERAAILRLVGEGGKRLLGLAVATKDGGIPCGACLQVIREFATRNLPIYIVAESGPPSEFTLADLMPHEFESAEVTRTSEPS